MKLWLRSNGLIDIAARLGQNEIRTKCKGLWLGAWSDRADQPFGFSWSKTLKINGVYFGFNGVYQNSSISYARAEGGKNV